MNDKSCSTGSDQPAQVHPAAGDDTARSNGAPCATETNEGTHTNSASDAETEPAAGEAPASPHRTRMPYQLVLQGSPRRPAFTVRCACGWESRHASSAGLAQSMGTAHYEAESECQREDAFDASEKAGE